jgi:hypothetical protein
MLSDLIKIVDRVKYILKEHPETRDSDKLLWLAYLCVFHDLKKALGMEKYLILKSLIMSEDTATMESVRRMRQKIQEEGHYRGEKYLERHAEAEDVRLYFADTGDVESADDHDLT